jgi:hypothetical protein
MPRPTTMIHPLRVRVARAFVPCFVLLLSACGGGNSPSEEPAAPAAAAAPAEASAADPEPSAAAEPGAEVNRDVAMSDAPEPADDDAVVEEKPAGAAREGTQQAASAGSASASSGAAAPQGSSVAGMEKSTETVEPPMVRAALLTDLPRAGYAGGYAVPLAARAENVSSPNIVVGTGTPESCTSWAFVRAVARGGVITFNCGSLPVTITLNTTAKIVNNARAHTVIDGGGKVTLSGGGVRRIIYMNTCDPDQVWTTAHCDNQDHPRLTLQNLTFVDGKASGTNAAGAYGGGAVFARGGRLKIVNSRFFRNRCDSTGPDVGGGAVRALDQYGGAPVYVVNSTFGGRSDLGNVCSNGGALSSIGVSWSIYNSLFTHNRAIGVGANPQRAGTPGGGSGGAIYNDGNLFHLRVFGSKLQYNKAPEGGGSIFFVSNDLTGTLSITNSILRYNPNLGFETAGFPGIFYLGSGPPQVSGSTIVN